MRVEGARRAATVLAHLELLQRLNQAGFSFTERADGLALPVLMR
jgi:hypothetical protein